MHNTASETKKKNFQNLKVIKLKIIDDIFHIIDQIKV